HWRVGHAELAIRHCAPVVPVAIVGAEEAWPQLGRLRVHPFGAPWLPVPLSPIPLPVHYHIWYGEPLMLHEGLEPGDADDPRLAEAAAARVREAVQALIDRGLRERPGVFR
ncbi:MAG: acyltransferase, partial [Polyangiales bacterium]